MSCRDGLLQHDEGARRRPWPLVGRQDVGVVRIEPVASRQLIRMPVSPRIIPWARPAKLLGVAETMLPCASTVARYVVPSASPPTGSSLGAVGCGSVVG